MSRARTVLAFHAVRSEGGLLSRDILQRIAVEDKALAGLSPENDYHLAPGERFRDAVNRAWSRLTVAWRAFQTALAKLPEGDPATTVTRERWLLPLFEALNYGRLPKASTFEVEGKNYAISHSYQKSPIHLLGCRVGLDTKQKGIVGAAATSPHGLVQDFLNRSDGHLWGFVSNGYVLRVLRDHHSLTQQAYVEFDLQAIMEGEAFSEFLLLWLVCHQSRVEAEKAADCWLEKWFQAARNDGVRALDRLRDGVIAAITALGTGFLAHKANKALLDALETRELDKQDYYRQLRRLAYRLIFLFVAEDRDALLNPIPSATEAARARYDRFYSTKRLRELADKRRGSAHGDLWQQLQLVMNKLENGSPELALPALGSFLWRSGAIRDLNDLELANEDLLNALRALCYVEQGRTRYAVSWRNIGAEELGSVYESLLDLHPKIHKEAARFELSSAGHERKTTGSYYTPASLVDCLLNSALDPVLDEAAKKPHPEKAILDLKVCDPACGSGHFLVAAARRIAARLAMVRAGGDEPSPPEVQRALRDVVGRCIYGVDLKSMAVELCKVSLWMEAIEPGKPLSFLEGHIREGNALFGATPALMAKGITDEALEAIDGDDKEVAKRLKKRNKKAREGQGTLFAGFAQGAPESYYGRITTAAARVEGDSDDNIGAVRKKEQSWEQLTGSEDYRKAMFLADAWCAAFVWPKQPGKLEDGAITDDLWRRMENDLKAVPEVTRIEVNKIAGQYAFFHWHLAFPQVFIIEHAGSKAEDKITGWSEGFDVVLGNPPWERIKLQEQEFFTSRSDEIVNAVNAAARKKLIAALQATDLMLWSDWRAANREAEGQSHFVRQSGRYPLCGKGDVNTYALFAEHNRTVLRSRGRAGFIVPTGIATDDTTKEYFSALVEGSELASFFSFENEDFVFPAVHHAFRFALLTVDRSGRSERTDLVFFARQVAALADPDRHFSLTPADFATLNPNTRTCPTFRSRRDADINLALYRRAGVLWREQDPDGNPWGLRFMAMLHMANDSELFRTRAELEAAGWKQEGNQYILHKRRMLPLFEAKMVHHFDHRFGTYEGQTTAQANQGKLPELDDKAHADPTSLTLPNYWVDESEAEARLEGRWQRGWLLGWRDICRSTDQRTVIASLIPRVAVGHKLPLLFSPRDSRLIAALYANLCSLVLDYTARQKVGGTSLTYFLLKQLPVLTPDVYAAPTPWAFDVPVRDWLVARALELTYTAWDLEPFARDCGYDGPPFRWDHERRLLLRAELDAAFFHLYGVSRDDTDHILDTFPVVRKNEEKAHGEYRTKRVVLEVYDALANAARSARPYRSALITEAKGH